MKNVECEKFKGCISFNKLKIDISNFIFDRIKKIKGKFKDCFKELICKISEENKNIKEEAFL